MATCSYHKEEVVQIRRVEGFPATETWAIVGIPEWLTDFAGATVVAQLRFSSIVVGVSVSVGYDTIHGA